MQTQPADAAPEPAPAATLVIPRDWRAHWNSVAQRCGRGEHLRQVERTEAGLPMPARRLACLVERIVDVLRLSPRTDLLDLCCGNGVLTRQLAARCRQVIGIDFSAELIAIARGDHAADNILYLPGSAADLAGALDGRAMPGRICVNSGLQYFGPDLLADMLQGAARASEGAAEIFCTDVPDVTRLYDFYDTPQRRADFIRRRAAGTEAIGTWWHADDIARIAAACGYRAAILPPEAERNTAHYRFDVLFTPH